MSSGEYGESVHVVDRRTRAVHKFVRILLQRFYLLYFGVPEILVVPTNDNGPISIWLSANKMIIDADSAPLLVVSLSECRFSRDVRQSGKHSSQSLSFLELPESA